MWRDSLSTVGDITSTEGDILSTVGDILSTVGDTGDFMMHVWDINILLFE